MTETKEDLEKARKEAEEDKEAELRIIRDAKLNVEALDLTIKAIDVRLYALEKKDTPVKPQRKPSTKESDKKDPKKSKRVCRFFMDGNCKFGHEIARTCEELEFGKCLAHWSL